MTRHPRSKLPALALGAILILSVAGCEFGNPTATPVANPTNTIQVQATATAQATATTVAVVTTEPTAEATGTPVSAAATPADTVQPGVTPVARQVVRFADYKLQATSIDPVLKPYTVAPEVANVSNA